MRGPLLFQILGLTLIASSAAMVVKSESRYQQALVQHTPPHIFEAPHDRVDPALEGKVVHITALLKSTVEARDEELGASAPGLELYRSVEECYQRNRKRKDWRSIRDKQSGLHSQKFYPAQTFLGPLTLPGEALENQLSGELLAVRPTLTKMPPGAVWKGKTLYLQGRPEAPQPGDRKVNYHRFAFQEMTAIGKQSQGGLLPPGGQRSVWLRSGAQSAEDYLKPFQQGWPAPWAERFQELFQLLLGLVLLGSPWIAQRLRRPPQEDPV